MKAKSLAALCVVGVATMVNLGAQSILLPIPKASEILATLRHEHPRLLASAKDFVRLKKDVVADAQLREWHRKLQERAQRILAEAPSRYEIPDGLRLLATSRRVLDRVYTLALLHRLDGDQRYVDRAWQELQAAANFPDWNPRHFLDTAEMTHAFAIGYDWLYDVWSAEQRATLRNAIVEKGVNLALGVYRGTAKFGSWQKAHHNWNQVCNGGIGIGALAIADEAPELAAEFLHGALESIQLPMSHFAPDGAWNEGPGYWNYATSYNIYFLAALESALGTDFKLSQMKGFSETGMFPIYITGPLGRTFNYADGSDGPIRAAQMFWLARKFSQPAYAAYERKIASPHPADLLWFDPDTDISSIKALPLDRYFRDAEVATFRSAWEDRDAVFVGFKAGDNKANHSNLDLGTFVLDALGVRWAIDLGADNYNLPGYFGGSRWTYYRLRAEGHNTLLINPGTAPDQDPKAASLITKFETKPGRAFAVADLTPAYSSQATSIRRGIALLDRKRVLIQDEVKAEKPAEIWWFLHTPAEVKVSAGGAAATLTQGSTRLAARILSPTNASFIVKDAVPLTTSPHPETQAKNEGVRKLAIHLEDVKDLRLAVELTPLREGESAPDTQLKLTSFNEW